MSGGVTGFFSRLRERPAHERWILALTTYVSAAAIVLAIGIASLRNAITPPAPAAEPAATPSGERSPENAEPSLAELVTPFQNLREALGAMAKNFRAAADHIKRLAEGAPPQGAGVRLPAERPAANEPETPALPLTMSETLKKSFPPGTTPGKSNAPLAELLTMELIRTSPSSYTLAKLLKPPPGVRAADGSFPSLTFGARLRATLASNAANLRQAAVDTYRYFTE